MNFIKKPAGYESIGEHFGCDSSKVIVVGDRMLTDIVYGNLAGCVTVLVTDIVTYKGDNYFAKKVLYPPI